MPEVHNKNNAIKTAYVDIDETICFYNGDRIYEEAIPNFENIQKINRLYDEGWIVIYWTARGNTQKDNIARMEYIYEMTLKQLVKWQARFHKLEIAKPFYDIIIDDRAKRIEEL